MSGVEGGGAFRSHTRSRKGVPLGKELGSVCASESTETSDKKQVVISHWSWIFVSPVFRSEKGTWNVRKHHQTHHPRLGAERGVQGAVVYVRVTHRGFLYFFFFPEDTSLILVLILGLAFISESHIHILIFFFIDFS